MMRKSKLSMALAVAICLGLSVRSTGQDGDGVGERWTAERILASSSTSDWRDAIQANRREREEIAAGLISISRDRSRGGDARARAIVLSGQLGRTDGVGALLPRVSESFPVFSGSLDHRLSHRQPARTALETMGWAAVPSVVDFVAGGHANDATERELARVMLTVCGREVAAAIASARSEATSTGASRRLAQFAELIRELPAEGE